jgi:hypothetical protein
MTLAPPCRPPVSVPGWCFRLRRARSWDRFHKAGPGSDWPLTSWRPRSVGFLTHTSTIKE